MTDVNEKFVSDDGYSTIPDAVDGAGGKVKSKLADLKKSANPNAEGVDAAPGNVSSKGAYKASASARDTVVAKTVALPEDVTEEVYEIDEAVAALFEGEELSESFKEKAGLIFSAAINEEVSRRLIQETENLQEELSSRIDEEIESRIETIAESLDVYLDRVVENWLDENRLAIESGIKVEMAESLMETLKSAFYEHNIEVNEDTVDIVSGLEEELSSLSKDLNSQINENINLLAELKYLQAEKVFNESVEGLTIAQADRLRVLSEKISYDDLDVYSHDLETLKESFFNTKTKSRSLFETVANEDETDEILVESSKSKTNNPSIAGYLNIFDKI